MDKSAVEGRKTVISAGVVNVSHESLSIIVCVYFVCFSVAPILMQGYTHF